MIKPSIGRVVLFWPGPPVHSEVQPMPALVAFVHSDRLINVGGFDMNGNPIKATSVTLLQDDDVPPSVGPYAEWMPYQKGQAAKTEALEASIGRVG